MKLKFRVLRGALVVSMLSVVAAPVVGTTAQAAAPSGVTTLVAPTEGETVGGDVTFSWTPVPGAVSYKVQVSRSPMFEAGSILPNTDITTVNVNFTPVVALPVDELYWRVAPTDGTLSGVGVYTQGSFTHVWASAPEVTGPLAGSPPLEYPKDPLLFTWNPLAGAQKYNIEIDDDINFISPLHAQSTTNTSYTLKDPQTNKQQFYWRVQGVSGGIVSPWSAPQGYSVVWPAVPELTWPPVGEWVTDVVLQWTPVAGATSYDVEISSNLDFTNNLAHSAVVKGTRYSPPDTLDNDDYFWRVRARDGKTPEPNTGAWTDKIHDVPAQFKRVWSQVPTINGPDLDFNVVSPTLEWDSVPYASHYEVWVSTDPNFSTFSTCTTNQTSFTPYSFVSGSTPPVPSPICTIGQRTLPIGARIYWKVRGIDGPGPAGKAILGQWSERAVFQITNNGAPTMTSPADGAVTGAANLTWEPVPDVARYLVTVEKNGAGVPGSPFTTYANSITPDKLTAGATYSWSVRTIDDQDRLGVAPASPWTFQYQPIEAVNTALVPLGPAHLADSALMPAMRWEPVVGATKYHVFRIEDGLQEQLVETTMTSFTEDAIQTAATFDWYVKALNATNTLLATSPVSTFTITELPIVTGLIPARCLDSNCPATPDTPKLSWTPVPGASGYRIYLSNDENFTNVVREYKTQHASLTPRESLRDSAAASGGVGDGAYYWFVQPCRNADEKLACGRFDGVHETSGAFRKRSLPVKLLSPAHGATISSDGVTHENVTFTWEEYRQTNNAVSAAQGAKKYRVQVYSDSSLNDLVEQIDVDQATYTPFKWTYPEGPLYWRVTALDGSGNELTRSELRLVTKSTPPLVTENPADGQTVSTTPYFKWKAQPHVRAYELEIYNNGDTLYSTGNRVQTFGTITTRLTAFTPTTPLPAGLYAWRVRRIDADNKPGPWSGGGVFTVRTTAPTLLTPAIGTTFNNNNMLFTWSAVPGAARYRFQASRNSSFTDVIESGKGIVTVMTAWAPTKLYSDGTIYWRVEALNATSDLPTAVSATWSVVRDATAPKVMTKTPTLNAPLIGGAFTVTFSEPVLGVSPTTFSLRVASTGSPVPGTTTPSATTATTTASFKPSVALTPGETYVAALTGGINDANQNALTPFTWSVRSALKVDAAAPIVAQYWDRDGSSLASGGAYLASRTAGSKLVFSFTGTSAYVVGRRAPDGGYAEVWLDGVKQGTATFYSSVTKWKQTVWSKTGLTNGPHKVELRVLNTRPSASKATWVYPDAFRYGTVNVEETSAQVTQLHRAVGLSGALGGSYLLATHTASGDTSTPPYVTVKFKGTGISWNGFRSASGGQARVYVDNVSKALVETYGSPSSSPSLLWRISGLPNGTHTLKILVTGTKATSSAGYNVAFDSFTVV